MKIPVCLCFQDDTGYEIVMNWLHVIICQRKICEIMLTHIVLYKFWVQINLPIFPTATHMCFPLSII